MSSCHDLGTPENTMLAARFGRSTTCLYCNHIHKTPISWLAACLPSGYQSTVEVGETAFAIDEEMLSSLQTEEKGEGEG